MQKAKLKSGREIERGEGGRFPSYLDIIFQHGDGQEEEDAVDTFSCCNDCPVVPYCDMTARLSCNIVGMFEGYRPGGLDDLGLSLEEAMEKGEG